MTKLDFVLWAKDRNWTEDKFGHLQKEHNETTYRFKLSSTAVRYERKAKIVDHNEWIRIASNYYKNLTINSQGKLEGLK
jgi:hypothetical protein